MIDIKDWVSFMQRIGVVSMDLVRGFYVAILLVPNILDPGWEVTVCNTRVLFSSDELARTIRGSSMRSL